MGSDSVGGEVQNAASRRYREVLGRVNAAVLGDVDPVALTAITMTEDFVREDRRRLIGLPPADRAQFSEQVLAWRDIADGKPTFRVPEVVAVAGDRLVLLVVSIEYASGQSVEMLQVVQFDDAVDRQQRIISFDGDDRDLALAELEALRAGLVTDNNTASPG